MERMKVVILCGGKGTRSYPFTEYFPKVMMPINGTPILVHLMRTYASQGFTDFVLAGGHRIEMLFDYFDGRFADWNVKIVDTGDDADTGDRILRCGALCRRALLCDLRRRPGRPRPACAARRRTSAPAGWPRSPRCPLRSQYGLVVFDENDKVRRFEEKPLIRDYWINAGFFVFEKHAFEQWHGHNLEQEVLPDFARRGRALRQPSHRASGSRWTPARTSRNWKHCASAATCLGNPGRPSRRMPDSTEQREIAISSIFLEGATGLRHRRHRAPGQLARARARRGAVLPWWRWSATARRAACLVRDGWLERDIHGARLPRRRRPPATRVRRIRRRHSVPSRRANAGGRGQGRPGGHAGGERARHLAAARRCAAGGCAPGSWLPRPTRPMAIRPICPIARTIRCRGAFRTTSRRAAPTSSPRCTRERSGCAPRSFAAAICSAAATSTSAVSFPASSPPRCAASRS